MAGDHSSHTARFWLFPSSIHIVYCFLKRICSNHTFKNYICSARRFVTQILNLRPSQTSITVPAIYGYCFSPTSPQDLIFKRPRQKKFLWLCIACTDILTQGTMWDWEHLQSFWTRGVLRCFATSFSRWRTRPSPEGVSIAQKCIVFTLTSVGKKLIWI